MAELFGRNPFLLVSEDEYFKGQDYRLAFRNLQPDRQALLRVKDLHPREFYAMELLIKIAEVIRMDRIIKVKTVSLNAAKQYEFAVSDDDLLTTKGVERGYLLNQLEDKRARWEEINRE